MGTIYYYMRISTEEERGKQKYSRQEQAIKSYCRNNQLEYDDEAAFRLGVEWATGQCEELLRNGVAGIHFYCLNESRGVEAILKNLGHPSA